MILLWFVFINLINAFSLTYLFDRTSYELPEKASIGFRHFWVPFLNFDGRNYLKIVLDGYEQGYVPDLKVFFPVFPLLVRVFSLNLTINPIVAGLSISLVFFVASVFMLDLLMRQDREIPASRFKAILFLFLFPTRFYFLSFYSESVFLFLVLSFFFFLNRNDFWAASVIALVASATRITGLALIVPLIWNAWQHYRITRKIAWPLLMSPLGFLMYAVFIQITAGSASGIILSQKNWNKPIGWKGPVVAVSDGFKKFIFGSQATTGNIFNRSMEVIEFVFAVALIVFVFVSFKKIKFSYWLYFLLSIALIFFSGVLSSVHRYSLVLFPVYIYLGKTIPKKYFFPYCFFSFILLIYLASLFFRGYWVA